MEPIVELITNKKILSWQSILYELVRSEQMDPWDINIVVITKKFIQIINQLKNMDFQLSGKMLLAAAILLKIKSEYFVKESEKIDDIFSQTEEMVPTEAFDMFDMPSDFEGNNEEENIEMPKIHPRNPKPRVKKISIYDLVNGLERAMRVHKRKLIKNKSKISEKKLKISKEKFDIEKLIKEMFKTITNILFKKKKRYINFSDLSKGVNKNAITYTLLPLLYLANDGKVELKQEKPFGDIKISM